MLYTRLVPMTNLSGESHRVDGMTKRQNKLLRMMIIESSWVAIRDDPALDVSLSKVRGKNEA